MLHLTAARKALYRIFPIVSLNTPVAMSSLTPSTPPTLASVRVIPNHKLYCSEPDPRWFGNEPNPKDDSSWTNENWLKSRFHFSFAEYHNPLNSQFGVLRVMNDDLVQPHRGFGTHPHANMEIITYIVDGELTHQDSMGTKESLGRGSVQFMTAGTGVRHSEFNHGDKPLRFIQTWIVPSDTGLKPNYGSFANPKETAQQCTNKLKHLVGNVLDTSESNQAPVQINQDVNTYAAELQLGQTVSQELPPARQAYLLCIEGGVKVNGQALQKYDACEIQGEAKVSTTVNIEASAAEPTENGELAHVLMFIMEQIPGSGRGDL